MTRKDTESREMVCPYCGYICQTTSIGAVYCGPHMASFGGNVSPAVQMKEKHPVNTPDREG